MSALCKERVRGPGTLQLLLLERGGGTKCIPEKHQYPLQATTAQRLFATCQESVPGPQFPCSCPSARAIKFAPRPIPDKATKRPLRNRPNIGNPKRCCWRHEHFYMFLFQGLRNVGLSDTSRTYPGGRGATALGQSLNCANQTAQNHGASRPQCKYTFAL